jgi:hypothetical protein
MSSTVWMSYKTFVEFCSNSPNQSRGSICRNGSAERSLKSGTADKTKLKMAPGVKPA